MSERRVHIKINGIPLAVREGTTILEAARKINISIPILCYHPDLPAWAACGICVVSVENSPRMLRACATLVTEGLSVITHDPDIVAVRKTVVELILSTHPTTCLQCPRNLECELQRLASDFGIREIPFKHSVARQPVDNSTTALIFDQEKCVKCGRCVNVCQGMQNVWALEFLGRGDLTRIAAAGNDSLEESPCIKCGQCSAHCPVGAIYEKDDTGKVWEAVRNPDVHCVVQIAPAVRVALGEAFGLAPGKLVTHKAYAALRRLGFDAIFDTNFGADLTIMEEGSELIERLKKGKGELPLITSCCPAWVDYLEKYYPDLIPLFSTAKSPQAMVGALSKTYYAQKMGLDPKKIVAVSIMPCTAKKWEIIRSETMYSSGMQDIDISLTTRELVRMIKSAGIDFTDLPDEDADPLLGIYTGAGTIFGTTGGVMEAALRTAHKVLNGKEMKNLDLQEVRGMEGVKEATLTMGGKDIKVAVAHQMGNIQKIMDMLREARDKKLPTPYHFIEVMACRGGCIGGGGQPYGATDDIRKKRIAGIYKDDHQSAERCSHNNPAIKKLYDEFLGEPLGKKAHELLHTHYIPRPLYQK